MGPRGSPGPPVWDLGNPGTSGTLRTPALGIPGDPRVLPALRRLLERSKAGMGGACWPSRLGEAPALSHRGLARSSSLCSPLPAVYVCACVCVCVCLCVRGGEPKEEEKASSKEGDPHARARARDAG